MAKSKAYMASYRARRGATVTSPMSARDFQQLSDYMQAKHGITLDQSVRQLDFDTVRSGCDGVEAVLAEFPQAASAVDRITYDPTTRAYAYARPSYDQATGTFKTELVMSSYFGDPARFSDRLSRDGHYHPPNSDARQVMAHETGHAMEMALIVKNSVSGSRYAAISEWNHGRQSTRIVGDAVRQFKKTPEGKGKRIGDILREVSGYAASDKRGRGRCEALAECVGDFTGNGSNLHVTD